MTQAVDIDDTPPTNISAFVRLSDPTLANVYSSSGTGATLDGKYTVNGLKQIIANIIAYQIQRQHHPMGDQSEPSSLPRPRKNTVCE